MQYRSVLQLSMVTALTTCFFVSVCSAQTPTFFGSGKTTSPTPGTSSKGVMSPSDFKNSVRSLSQQNQASLTQQINQQLSTLPPPPGSGSTTAPTSNTMRPPTTTAPTAAASSTTTTTTQPAQPQTFTGFGGGGSTTTQPTTPSTSTPSKSHPPAGGGNWNINY